MKVYKQQENITMIGVEVTTFPRGVKEAFDTLGKTLGTQRDYYGVSWMDEGDAVKYYAMAREVSPGEAKQYQYETMTLESGEYATEAIHEWLSKTDSIKDVLHELTKGVRPDRAHPCIEWYKSDDEMLCMFKLS